MSEPPQPDFAIPDPEALQGEAGAPGAPAGPEAPSAFGAVLERQRVALMATEGVVMVGEGQDAIGGPAILVGVKEHHQLATLPKAVDGVPVVGIVIGEVDALGGAGATPRRPGQGRRRSPG
jgi:hypothetical protein